MECSYHIQETHGSPFYLGKTDAQEMGACQQLDNGRYTMRRMDFLITSKSIQAVLHTLRLCLCMYMCVCVYMYIWKC